MSAEPSAVAQSASAKTQWLDIASIVICTLAWGTTWYAITLQLGVVDPVVSVVYRFALAAVLLFAFGALRGERLAMSRAQHFAALGVGVTTFAINYPAVYMAEARVTSAVVAVLFAAMAFVNLGLFRLVLGERAPRLAWAAAGLGIAGVALMSWEEVSSATMSARAWAGIALTLLGVLASGLGNLCARQGEGAGVVASTAWAMAYGSGLLALFVVATGKTWTFEWTWTYSLSLLYLAIAGSVIAFVLYFGLARRRGYALASYISALTPPVAMLVSALFEAKSWGFAALGGVALVLSGQVLLLRARRQD